MPEEPLPRYGPGADLVGATVVGDTATGYKLRCRGHNDTCQTAFDATFQQIREAQAKGQALRCPGCADPPAVPKPLRDPRRGSYRDVLLRAAWATGGSGDFSTFEIVVAAWRISPKRFGLPGYERLYPHSNRVICNLCRRTNNVGFWCMITRTGENRFRLRPEAAALARKKFGPTEDRVLRRNPEWRPVDLASPTPATV